MSTIERVANMLGPVAQPLRKPAVHEEPADVAAPDLIERAISKKALRPELREEKGAGEKVDFAPAPVGDARKSSRTITLDIAKLREQNMITPDGARSPITEGFRRIKRHVLANLANPGTGAAANLLMVTSPLAGEGKTFCTINLAVSIAMEIDRRVLLVDADVAKPSVPRVLGIEAERGLMDVVLDRNIDLADVLLRTNIDGLSLLPAGTQHQHATEMLASEAAVLATRMGQIVVVVEAGKTTETELKDALSRIESCNLAGLLLNKGGAPGSGYYGGYGYGYGA